MDNEQITKATSENAQTAAEFAANMTKVAERSSEIWMKLLKANMSDERALHADPLNTLPAFAEFQQALASNPQELAERTLELWSQQAELWRRMTMKWIGGEAPEPVAQPERGDKRFTDEEWSNNQIFDYIKQSYLLTSRYLLDTA